ncbi:MAG: hypothetical protein ABS34_08670 [Opitutaceae bacterium BACL24 MAG-120322-bin51]|nr:MAG: hypothetical protein ABS34_08670 [Opitutaceae bacterium BACL24 MAG-120322-bin51]
MIQTAATYTSKHSAATTGRNTSMAGVDFVATLTEVLFFLAIPHEKVRTVKYAKTSRSIRRLDR